MADPWRRGPVDFAAFAAPRVGPAVAERLLAGPVDEVESTEDDILDQVRDIATRLEHGQRPHHPGLQLGMPRVFRVHTVPRRVGRRQQLVESLNEHGVDRRCVHRRRVATPVPVAAADVASRHGPVGLAAACYRVDWGTTLAALGDTDEQERRPWFRPDTAGTVLRQLVASHLRELAGRDVRRPSGGADDLALPRAQARVPGVAKHPDDPACLKADVFASRVTSRGAPSFRGHRLRDALGRVAGERQRKHSADQRLARRIDLERLDDSAAGADRYGDSVAVDLDARVSAPADAAA